MSRPEVITLGCRLNTSESEAMSAFAEKAGLTDTVIINTCAVTNEAVRRSRQTVRRVRRAQPQARIIVTGCAVQIDADRFADMPEVDHIIGNDEKTRPDAFMALAEDNGLRVRVNDIMSVRETAPHLIDGYDARSRAIVQIQNGCDHRCTFCIIPFGRGPSRSVPAGRVVDQIRQLVAHGFREVILTGVDLTSYGPDLPGGMTLGKLVRHILRHVPELDRLRLSSVDQVEVDADLLAALAEEPRLMPHLHLSLQSGDDMILKRMKRRHLRDDAIRFCETARRLRPEIVFGADLIAGFPTETDAMFANSLDLVSACGLTYLHVFPFSPRHGTPAARMPQVDGVVIKERASRLRQLGDAILSDFLSAKVGQQVDVLMEADHIGRTEQFVEVALQTDVAAPAGAMMRVNVAGHDGVRLSGEVMSP